MEVLGAFMACALISVLTQLMVECIRGIHGPTLFLLVQAVGALLVPLGAIAALQAFGQAGIRARLRSFSACFSRSPSWASPPARCA